TILQPPLRRRSEELAMGQAFQREEVDAGFTETPGQRMVQLLHCAQTDTISARVFLDPLAHPVWKHWGCGVSQRQRELGSIAIIERLAPLSLAQCLEPLPLRFTQVQGRENGCGGSRKMRTHAPGMGKDHDWKRSARALTPSSKPSD